MEVGIYLGFRHVQAGQSTWPDGPGLKPTGEITLDPSVDGDAVVGTVHIGSWPGDAPIEKGKFTRTRITFEATGHLASSSGIPTCYFEATRKGDEMVLTMRMKEASGELGEAFKFKGRKLWWQVPLF
jgi:hypothetical protein